MNNRCEFTSGIHGTANPLDFGKRIPTFGILFNVFSEIYENTVLSGIEKYADENNLRLIYLNGGAINAPKYHSIICKNDVYALPSTVSFDGLIIFSSSISSFIEKEKFVSFCNNFSGIPIVSIGIDVEKHTSLVIDNYTAMKMLVSHFIDVHGYTRIAYVSGPEKNEESIDRLEAYRDCLSEHDIAYDGDLVTYGYFYGNSGRDAVSILLDERRCEFDSIICANDYMAVQAIESLAGRGIAVPRKIAVAGFDNTRESRCLQSPLTTVNQPIFDMGYVAARSLHCLVSDGKVPRKIIFPTKTIIRNSCGCIPQSPFGDIGDPWIPSVKTLNEEGPVTRLSHDLADTLYTFFSDTFNRSWCEDAAREISRNLFSAVNSNNKEYFLEFIRSLTCAVIHDSSDASVLQEIIDFMFHIARQSNHSSKAARQIGQIQRAFGSIIREVCEKVQEYKKVNSIEQDYKACQINQSLQDAYSMDALETIIREYFPELGITGCHIALYCEPVSFSPNKYARLIFSFREKEPISEAFRDQPFPANRIVPGGVDIFHPGRRNIISTIRDGDIPAGYIVLESLTTVPKTVYENLTFQLACTVKRITHDWNRDQTTKYRSYSLSPEKTGDLFDRLMEYMHTKMPYKDPDLSLEELAKKVCIPRTYLSFIINKYAGVNFFDFINKYRVEYAKTRLASPENSALSILDIAMDSGFNSKSTFNKFFKKHTELTPLHYRKQFLLTRVEADSPMHPLS